MHCELHCGHNDWHNDWGHGRMTESAWGNCQTVGLASCYCKESSPVKVKVCAHMPCFFGVSLHAILTLLLTQHVGLL
jgi:hypothetical protein